METKDLNAELSKLQPAARIAEGFEKALAKTSSHGTFIMFVTKSILMCSDAMADEKMPPPISAMYLTFSRLLSEVFGKALVAVGEGASYEKLREEFERRYALAADEYRKELSIEVLLSSDPETGAKLGKMAACGEPDCEQCNEARRRGILKEDGSIDMAKLIAAMRGGEPTVLH